MSNNIGLDQTAHWEKSGLGLQCLHLATLILAMYMVNLASAIDQ